MNQEMHCDSPRFIEGDLETAIARLTRQVENIEARCGPSPYTQRLRTQIKALKMQLTQSMDTRLPQLI